MGNGWHGQLENIDHALDWKFVSDIGFLVSTTNCVIAFGFIFVGNVRFGYRHGESSSVEMYEAK
jgi:hypothetical protein